MCVHSNNDIFHVHNYNKDLFYRYVWQVHCSSMADSQIHVCIIVSWFALFMNFATVVWSDATEVAALCNSENADQCYTLYNSTTSHMSWNDAQQICQVCNVKCYWIIVKI